MNCLFCKIANGEIAARKVFEDDQCLAFEDLHPQAPVHLLVIPREHIDSLARAASEHEAILGHLLGAVAPIARQQKLDKGFRVVVNTGEQGGQTVDHLHLHVLGGRPMNWPPG